MRRNESVVGDRAYSDLLALRAPALSLARAVSLQMLDVLGKSLAHEPALLDGVSTLVAAGSLGRLEAHAHSDFDCLLIVGEAHGANVDPALFALVEAVGLKAPKADGIYRIGTTASALCQSADRGSLEEPAMRFGQRMQLLLDARPVTGGAAFASLQRQVLQWYAGDSLAREGDAQWTLLINDISRYLHAYAAWQQFKRSRDEADGWYLRQAKLRSSRMVGFAGLMFLLGASSTLGTAKFDWVLGRLPLGSLARVAEVMLPKDSAAFERLLADYDAVHALLADGAVRRALVESSPGEGEPLPGRWPEPYAEIHARSARILRELSAFVLARSSDWHPAFFSYLLF